ncbi:hypothetical protein JMJ56_08385 [Belnapia sp. T18]|uniref:Uncharacterized protein n=1 Tax=Belnapia arida TaxID=2804533 RepID=A0ABS1U011_9PROT|nr:hypothetical protein [Belnapia arida]MBL6078020.1 hypothetical protein [Belnapia arida]
MDDDLRAAWTRHAAARQRFLEMAAHVVPPAKLAEQARRLGLQLDRELAQVGEEELAYAIDLAIYAAPPGRSRAIDRIARQHARLTTEAALVLNALSHAWLSIFRVEDNHPDAGLLLEDTLLGGQVWVLDEGLAEAAEPGSIVATRLGRVHGYAITTGVHLVLDEPALASIREVLARGGLAPAELLEDTRFTEGLWRRALGFGPG